MIHSSEIHSLAAEALLKNAAAVISLNKQLLCDIEALEDELTKKCHELNAMRRQIGFLEAALAAQRDRAS